MKTNRTNKPAVFLLLLSVFFIGAGILRDATVLIKSINICLECIGIS